MSAHGNKVRPGDSVFKYNGALVEERIESSHWYEAESTRTLHTRWEDIRWLTQVRQKHYFRPTALGRAVFLVTRRYPEIVFDGTLDEDHRVHLQGPIHLIINGDLRSPGGGSPLIVGDMVKPYPSVTVKGNIYAGSAPTITTIGQTP